MSEKIKQLPWEFRQRKAHTDASVNWADAVCHFSKETMTPVFALNLLWSKPSYWSTMSVVSCASPLQIVEQGSTEEDLG